MRTPAEIAKWARLRAGLFKPIDAAKEIGCSRTLVLAWEDASATLRGSGYLLDAARAYGVSPNLLAYGDGAETPAERPDAATEAVPITATQTDLARGLEAVVRLQTYLSQALAATIPTAAREVLAAVDTRMPQDLRETPYTQAIRTAIVGQLANNDMVATQGSPKTSRPTSRRKRR